MFKKIHANKYAKFAPLGIIPVILGVLAIYPLPAKASPPTASADCSTGRLNLSMTPPQNHAYWAIRVDNKDNSWTPDAMQEGDFQYNKYKENSYGRNVSRGKQYNWWVHSISKNGVWSDSKGGTVNCPLKEPLYLESSYKQSALTLTWRPVEGAVKYALRVDDLTVSPEGYKPQDPASDDKMLDNLKTNSYTFGIGRNRKVVFWVHAIDKYGVWSDSSDWKHVTTK